MSERTVRNAEVILQNLFRAEGKGRELTRTVREAQSSISQLQSMTAGLMRGDLTSVISFLASLGPYGILAALGVGATGIGYGIYQAVTTERPTELYHWRYPE